MTQNDPFLPAREAMVRDQIEQRGIRDARLLSAFRHVPRHAFVPPELHAEAYNDHPLPIGQGQTISQPYIVAAMTNLLALRGSERVLEIGTGSGYQAAILGEMAAEVYSIERHSDLADQAQKLLAELGYSNIHIRAGDGSNGWPEFAPYDAVIVTAAAPELPPAFPDQIAEGGQVIIPVGGPDGQTLQRWRKKDGKMFAQDIFPVAFVPLRGQFGWQPEQW